MNPDSPFYFGDSSQLNLNAWYSADDFLANHLSVYGEWVSRQLKCSAKDIHIIRANLGSKRYGDVILTAIHAASVGSSNVWVSNLFSSSHPHVLSEIKSFEFFERSHIQDTPLARFTGSVLQNVTLGDVALFGAVSCEIRALGCPIALTELTRVESPSADRESSTTLLWIERKHIEALLKFLEDLTRVDFDRRSSLHTLDSKSGVHSWDSTIIKAEAGADLVLDPSVVNLVSRDIDHFHSRRSWFEKNHLPFTRGYLFHGPPGNGKTSLIRSEVKKRQADAYTIRLFSPNITDQSLDELYKRAADNAPSFVLLEDLDRAFPKTGERKSNLTLQTLLNSMDGVATRDGVITIATANEPTILDKAVLRRPGRFDRVVLFDNPNSSLRMEYFRRKSSILTEEDLQQVAKVTDGFSFAQLQETYILSGQHSFQAGSEEVSVDSLIYGATTLRETAQEPGKKALSVGFKNK